MAKRTRRKSSKCGTHCRNAKRVMNACKKEKGPRAKGACMRKQWRKIKR